MFVRMLTVLALASLVAAEQTDSAFKVIWNVPSSECAPFNVTIDPAQYGFTVNSGDTFLGDQIALIYGPGLFPEILANGSRVNGGIPQLGKLQPHLEKLSTDLQRAIPDVNFSGLAVIDFESWTPWFAEAQSQYRDAALELVRGEHPNWDEERVQEQAREDWEWWARLFLEKTLTAAEAVRPAAVWGYYQYPLCENLHIVNGTCPQAMRDRNDQLSWLMGDSRALYPSIYLFRNGFSNADRYATVAGRLVEAQRHAAGLPILTYTWFQYHDDARYLSDEDLLIMLGEPAGRGLGGAIMWGSTANCNTAVQCLRLDNYLRHHLGPLVRTLTLLTPAERDTWRLLMETAAGRRLLRLAIKQRARTDMYRLHEEGEQALATELERLLTEAVAMSFSKDGAESNMLSDEGPEITDNSKESKMNYRQLGKMRKWQSSLGRQLWEVKRTQERSSIAGEPGAAV